MKIHCKYDELVDTHDLKPNPQNPNIHPKKQIEQLARIIENTGWRTAIVVSRRSGYITRGHGRLAAAVLAGHQKVPVDFQNYESDDEEKADLLADNKIAELSQRDQALVKTLLGSMDETFDMSLTGYDTEAFINDAAQAAGVKTESVEEVKYPIVPKLDEQYTAFVIVCQTRDQVLEVGDAIGTEKHQSYKSQQIALTHVVSAEKFLKKTALQK